MATRPERFQMCLSCSGLRDKKNTATLSVVPGCLFERGLLELDSLSSMRPCSWFQARWRALPSRLATACPRQGVGTFDLDGDSRARPAFCETIERGPAKSESPEAVRFQLYFRCACRSLKSESRRATPASAGFSGERNKSIDRKEEPTRRRRLGEEVTISRRPPPAGSEENREAPPHTEPPGQGALEGAPEPADRPRRDDLTPSTRERSRLLVIRAAERPETSPGHGQSRASATPGEGCSTKTEVTRPGHLDDALRLQGDTLELLFGVC